jgi:hypothetical protein
MKNLISPGAGLALLAGLALSAVTWTASPAGQPSYVFDSRVDLFGYYMPTADVKVGKFKLNNLAIGAKDDFKKYLAGDRMATYAPVMIAFDDVTSPQKTNETGQPYYENSPRVLPAAFKISGASVTFAGHDKQLGDVSFSGALAPFMLDPKFKPEQRAAMSMPALTGNLTVNGKAQKVMFTWFGGD